ICFCDLTCLPLDHQECWHSSSDINICIRHVHDRTRCNVFQFFVFKCLRKNGKSVLTNTTQRIYRSRASVLGTRPFSNSCQCRSGWCCLRAQNFECCACSGLKMIRFPIVSGKPKTERQSPRGGCGGHLPNNPPK